MIYTSCSDFPLYNFIKLQVTKDFVWLGECSDPVKLWEAIYSEYCELMGDSKSERNLFLAIQIPYLSNRIVQVDILCKYMWDTGRKVPGMITLLQNEYGFRLKFDDLKRDITRALTQIKSDTLKLERYKREYETVPDESQTKESDFTSVLNMLGKHQGYRINQKETTVAEYVQLIKDYNIANSNNGRQ